jgi:predicted RNase H-like HicB family nuclease
VTFTVIYEHGPNEEGRETWSAYIPDLPDAVVTAGDSRAECEANMREALVLYVETMRDLGRPIPALSSEVGQIEVTA